MTPIAFATAVAVLLLAPGPTNTLMGLAGAQGGPGRVLRLLPAELTGYLAAILPLAFLGAGVLDRWPVLAVGVKVAAAVWVMVLAVRLWRIPAAAQGGAEAVTWRRIWLTTLLNPKALVIGLVLLPAPGEALFVPYLMLFCAMVAGAALAWGCAGRMVQRGGGAGCMRMVQRAASVWLALVSVSLVVGLMTA